MRGFGLLYVCGLRKGSFRQLRCLEYVFHVENHEG